MGSEFNSKWHFSTTRPSTVVSLCPLSSWKLFSPPLDGPLDGGAAFSMAELVRELHPALGRQMFLEAKVSVLLWLELWKSSPREDRDFPRRPHLKNRWADFGPDSGTSGGTAVDDKNVFISFEKKSNKKARSITWQNRDLFPSSKLGMGNNE